MNQDFKELLAAFNAEQVKYLIIGGYAVIKHTEPRYTKDLDLWIGVTDGNPERVYRALQRFGAPLTNLVESDLGGLTIYFISAADLIINKEAVGRYQDLADVEKLKIAQERIAGGQR